MTQLLKQLDHGRSQAHFNNNVIGSAKKTASIAAKTDTAISSENGDVNSQINFKDIFSSLNSVSLKKMAKAQPFQLRLDNKISNVIDEALEEQKVVKKLHSKSSNSAALNGSASLKQNTSDGADFLLINEGIHPNTNLDSAITPKTSDWENQKVITENPSLKMGGLESNLNANEGINLQLLSNQLADLKDSNMGNLNSKMMSPIDGKNLQIFVRETASLEPALKLSSQTLDNLQLMQNSADVDLQNSGQEIDPQELVGEQKFNNGLAKNETVFDQMKTNESTFLDHETINGASANERPTQALNQGAFAPIAKSIENGLNEKFAAGSLKTNLEGEAAQNKNVITSVAKTDGGSSSMSRGLLHNGGQLQGLKQGVENEKLSTQTEKQSIDRKEVMKNFIDNMTNAIRESRKEFSIKLTPHQKELGMITIKMRMNVKGKAYAHFDAQNESAYSLLKESSVEIENLLQNFGMETDPNSLSFSMDKNGGQSFSNFATDTQSIDSMPEIVMSDKSTIYNYVKDSAHYDVTNFDGSEKIDILV